MATNKQIYEQLTGSEKDRFVKEMGQLNYDKLVSHLREVLGIKSPGTKGRNTPVLPSKKIARESER